MDHAFLRSARKPPHALRVLRSILAAGLPLLLSLGLPIALSGCKFFDDADLEFDPARLRDSTLTVLPATESFQVRRKHILESFGSYGCPSCPDAEKKLLPYIHPELNASGYNPNLVIVNYHVKFGTLADPWITPATQARYDQAFANSLPQATMDGSNAQFGLPEKDVNPGKGEYDSLVSRLRISDSLTYLDLRLETTGLTYDSVTQLLHIHFSLSNRSQQSTGALSFRVLAVKNLPAAIPIYPPWEVIVVETTTLDFTGRQMSLNDLAPLTAKSFSVALSLPPEGPKQVSPPPLGMENPQDYALVIVAEDGNGLARNVLFHQYHPSSVP